MEIVIVAIVALLAVAAVLYPIVRPAGGRRAPVIEDAATLDAELGRYRAALRAGTLCLECGQPNPDDSTFCAQCGARLIAGRFAADAGADAEEATTPAGE